jgi:hypothetical protein
MIGFIGNAITTTLNYSHLEQLTINVCLRLAPFLTGLRVSTVTDLVLNYESIPYESLGTNDERRVTFE